MYPIERGISQAEPTGWSHPIWYRQEMPHDARYEALVDLARLAQAFRLGLHPTRTSPLLRVDHRDGPERRGAHRHPVGPGHRTARRLEGPGDLRRDRLLAHGFRDGRSDPAGGGGPRPDLARLPRLCRR